MWAMLLAGLPLWFSLGQQRSGVLPTCLLGVPGTQAGRLPIIAAQDRNILQGYPVHLAFVSLNSLDDIASGERQENPEVGSETQRCPCVLSCNAFSFSGEEWTSQALPFVGCSYLGYVIFLICLIFSLDVAPFHPSKGGGLCKFLQHCFHSF